MSERLSARISEALARLVERAAPANESAGVKALLILGAAQAGYDLGELRRDLALLLAEDLDPAIEAALRGLSDSRQTGGVQRHEPTIEAEPGEEPEDPFAIGFEV